MANISGGTITWVLDADTSKFNKGLAQAKAKASSFGNTVSAQNKDIEKQANGLTAVLESLARSAK